MVAVDATVIKVADELRSVWRGCRHSRPAAVKVHTRIRALTGELLRYRITPETYGDNKAFGVSHQDRGTLFLTRLSPSSGRHPLILRRLESRTPDMGRSSNDTTAPPDRVADAQVGPGKPGTCLVEHLAQFSDRAGSVWAAQGRQRDPQFPVGYLQVAAGA